MLREHNLLSGGHNRLIVACRVRHVPAHIDEPRFLQELGQLVATEGTILSFAVMRDPFFAVASHDKMLQGILIAFPIPHLKDDASLATGIVNMWSRGVRFILKDGVVIADAGDEHAAA